MKTIGLLLGLLLTGCSSLPPVTQSCLDDPPTDPFMVSMCKTLVSLPERDRADRARWEAYGMLTAPKPPLLPIAPIAFPSIQEESWSFYSTPYGTFTNLGDGYIADPKGRILFPY